MMKYILFALCFSASWANAMDLSTAKIRVSPFTVELEDSGWFEPPRVKIHITSSKGRKVTLERSRRDISFCQINCLVESYSAVVEVAKLQCKYIIIDGEQSDRHVFTVSDIDLPNCTKQMD